MGTARRIAVVASVAVAIALAWAAAAVALGGCGDGPVAGAPPEREGEAERIRPGRPGVTHDPSGQELGPLDAHRRPGAGMAAPVIRGPLADPGVPVVFFVHGGGWLETGPELTAGSTVERWAQAGAAVWSTDYRRSYDSLPDVEWAYGQLRERVGPDRRVCTHGQSAGAQLALMVAAANPDVACVISDSGAVDLARMPEGSFIEIEVEDWLLAHGGLERWDPVTNARRIRQPVLLVAHPEDPVVPVAHSRRLHRRLPRSAYLELPPGPADGPASYHGAPTTERAAARAWRAMRRLVFDGRLPAVSDARGSRRR
jgi:acetyl esterase/lipase